MSDLLYLVSGGIAYPPTAKYTDWQTNTGETVRFEVITKHRPLAPYKLQLACHFIKPGQGQIFNIGEIYIVNSDFQAQFERTITQEPKNSRYFPFP